MTLYERIVLRVARRLLADSELARDAAQEVFLRLHAKLGKFQEELVAAALQELSPREREAIVLRDLEGLSTAEVARVLRSSEGTVRSQISTGRVKIKKFILAQLGRRP